MMTRRRFLAGTSGLVVAVALPGCSRAPVPSAAVEGESFLTPYLHVGSDGVVTLYSPTTEMGQGTHTGHAVIIADELGVDLVQVRVVTAEPADPFRRNGSMGSGGSWGVRFWYDPLRKAAAQAREMLIAAGAERLAVEPGSLRLANGRLLLDDGRSLDIGAVAAAASALPPPDDPPLRSSAERRYATQPAPRVDLDPKIRGAPVYAMDLERPGMVYACARLSDSYGARAAGFDSKTALAIRGVMDVIAIPGGAAVIASDSWAAMSGATALDIRFEPADAGLSSAAISAAMQAALGDDAKAVEARNDGDTENAFAAAARSFTADYEAPYLAHTPMETWACLLEFDGDGVLHVWAPSQVQDRMRNRAAEVAGLDVDKVRLHTTLLGGGFGRRLSTDGIPGAVATVMALRKPVMFFWRREDEIGQGWYRPAQMARIRAAIDSDGKVSALHVRTAGPSLVAHFSSNGLAEGALDASSVQAIADSRYRPGAFRVDWVHVPEPVPVAPWRSVGATQNGFFMEAFIDELAAALVRDPYELRRELLAHDARALNVIDTVAKASGWGTPLPTGRARGMSYVESYGSLCAQVAEVSLVDGRPHVHRIVCALDCGSIVLPDGVRSQIEGGIVQGLSAALGEAIRIENGQATNRNFDTYSILRMSDAPDRIDAVIIESGETMGGVGEPPLPPAAPALVNALFALTGKPVRKLPLSQMSWA